jgi:hypothetical protein
VALFRRSSTPTEPAPPGATPARSGSTPIAKSDPKRATPNRATPTRTTPDRTGPEPTGLGKKDRPTPSRREAEAARRQRVNQTLTPKEARRRAAQQNRSQRLRVVSAREAVPEKALMRDYVDARFSLGEFLLPSLVVILALSFLATALPALAWFSTVLMYVFILAVLLDCTLMWRGFKRVLAQRMPGTPTRGLMMYGVNRCIQIRRFRMPSPRVKRGEAY